MSNSPNDDSDPIGLPEQCQPGMTFRINYSNSEPSEVWHVRAIVDGRAVVRTWDRSNQRWRYDVFGPGHFIGFFKRISWRKS